MKIKMGHLVPVLLAAGLFVGVTALAGSSTKAEQAEQELRVVLAAKPDPAHGERLFAICTQCHGGSGQGSASGWPPQIAGQHRSVVARELVEFRVGLRLYDPMSRIAGRHVLGAPQDVADVAAYVAGLTPVQDDTETPTAGLNQASSLYVARCQDCHGADGQGSDAGYVPRVAGQRYEYLRRQIEDAATGRRPDMHGQHDALLRDLPVGVFAGLAAYMSGLHRAGE
ncbi:MAG: cytochrome c [Proteobacteria bacterium]|nr:cytochrome c [Pseudomonadota bacterium]